LGGSSGVQLIGLERRAKQDELNNCGSGENYTCRSYGSVMTIDVNVDHGGDWRGWFGCISGLYLIGFGSIQWIDRNRSLLGWSLIAGGLAIGLIGYFAALGLSLWSW
jgi:hypothetical protein